MKFMHTLEKALALLVENKNPSTTEKVNISNKLIPV